jgi:acyl-CoA synthetase (NDP forming)
VAERSGGVSQEDRRGVSQEDRRAAVRRMLEPRSIAVVGASDRPGSFGRRMVTEALRSPARPVVHPVHPAYDQVQGLRCVPSVADLDPVDLALLGVPDRALVDQVSLASSRGAGGAVVFGSAVGLADRVRAVAGSMPLLGPACMGFVNVARGVRAIGYLERAGLAPGPIALVSHSGSAFSALLRTHRRLDYALAVSSGQELVTTTADFLDYALDQPETRVVGLLVETMREPARLRAALARAASEDVAVVALTVGSSAVGGALVGAHSGALAGADGAWEALCRAYGVHRVRDLDELVDTLELFALARRPRPGVPGSKPLGLATVHDSGGERALLADVAATLGVPFAELGVATLAELTGLLDHGLEPGNPLDVWGTGADTEALLTGCLTTVAHDPSVGVTALAVDLVEEYDGDESYPAAALAAHAATDAPLVVLTSTAASVHQPTADLLRDAGVPVLEGHGPGLRALGHLLANASPARPRPALPAEAHGTLTGKPVRLPTEPSALLAALGDLGVPVVATATVRSAAEAVAVAAEAGFPVALKTAAVAHKSDVGGVVLGLSSAAEVAAAYEALAARLGPEVVVQAMAAPGVELALGVVRDPHLGPLVVMGVGGTLVELVAERAVALPPFDEAAATALLAELPRVSALLAGVRGAPAADLPAVAAAVAALSRVAVALDDDVVALDVNPLVCAPAGCVAVDALLVAAPRAG